MSLVFKAGSHGEPDAQSASTTAAEVERWLVHRIAQMVQLDPDDIDVRIPFEHYGLDSRSVTSMAGELEESLGFELPATLLWDYPTIAEAAAYLADEYACEGRARG